jgi:hypothetical protein
VNDPLILWHVDPMLGNDNEMSNYTTTIPKQRHTANKHVSMVAREYSNNGSGVYFAVRVEML